MNMQTRRKFLKLSSTAALLPAVTLPASAWGKRLYEKNPVSLTGDGLDLSPSAYAQLLQQLTTNNKLVADNYSLGGCVEELENKFAVKLGKEAAVFMPTGTLANQLAIRNHAGPNYRVLVQGESHVYNDTGDGCQVLSNLNLMPLGSGKASFTLEEVEATIKKTSTGRVAAKAGVISIESPVRRKSGEVFHYDDMKKICTYAKINDIKTHLDGARIFLASPYTGVSVKEYASLFDTVYISLYKYFNAASGAILAGNKKFIEPLYHQRRMFGSGLHQSWAFAAVANHYADGFEERYAKAVKISEEFITRLKNSTRFEVQRVDNGSNIFRIKINGLMSAAFIESLKKNGVIARADTTKTDMLICQVNESILHTTAAELETKFVACLSK
jgi:threonine aldolase